MKATFLKRNPFWLALSLVLMLMLFTVTGVPSAVV